MDTFIEITFDLFCILFFAALMYGLIYPIYLGPEKYKAFKEKMRREEEERRRIKKLRKTAERKYYADDFFGDGGTSLIL